MKKDTVETLIEYYKWIVHISILVIGVSISLISSLEELHYSDKLSWGIISLLASIFFNWLIIKRLATGLVIDTEQVDTGLVKIFKKNKTLSAIYGLLQNWLFIIGLILIIWSFISGDNVSGININF